MNNGLISTECYIGRFLYLTDLLEHKLANVTFSCLKGKEALAIYSWNPDDGRMSRKRITASNGEWDKYYTIAILRRKAEESLKKLMILWKEEHKESLKELSKGYFIKPNIDSPYSSELWNNLKENSCNIKKDREIPYKGLIMRSIFETQVAQILEQLDIDYKYETLLDFGYRKSLSPDFSLNFPEYNRCGFAEVLGALGNFNYLNGCIDKYGKYLTHGLYPNRDVVFIPGDADYRPQEETIMRMIGIIWDCISKQHVFKKDDPEEFRFQKDTRTIV